MIGKHEVVVESVRLQYKFTLERNITILKGDSATGKTTLIDMIAAFEANGKDSGVTIKCDKKCCVLTTQNWQLNLSQIKNSIVFIDEGCEFVSSIEFARQIKDTDNYYVIATRKRLPNLPIGITEIYGITNKTSKRINKYQGTKRLYSSFKQINSLKLDEIEKPDLVIVEDSNSGYEFFLSVFEKFKIKCISAKGKSNVFKEVSQSNANSILVIADGAAFGSEVEQLMHLKKLRDITLYLPESFEWIILKSGLISNVSKILEDPQNYIESRSHFSWESFFVDLLISKTKGTYFVYSKSKLNRIYLQPKEQTQIMTVVPKLNLED